MKKVLYCAAVASHLRNFHLPYIKWLGENGCEVTALTGDGQAVPYAGGAKTAAFTKKLLSASNAKAVLDVRKLIAAEKYDAVVTNTTLAGAVVRAAILLLPRRGRPKVLHICHGFLFGEKDGIKGAAYLAVEKICSRVTDIFAVMNRECERIARKGRLGREIAFTRGMGIDISGFGSAASGFSGAASGFGSGFGGAAAGRGAGFGGAAAGREDYRFVYVAEFSARKNQGELISAFGALARALPDASLVLAGTGATLRKCEAMAGKLACADRICFPGHVSDVAALLAGCDCAVSSSHYEGLPFNIMEAMASGLPIVASRISGHVDLLGGEGDAGGAGCADGTDGAPRSGVGADNGVDAGNGAPRSGAILYEGEAGLIAAMRRQYACGKRRVAYGNLREYVLEKAMPEWKAIFSSVIELRKPEH